jgi:small-conductance mechanosensitive channel
LDENVNLQAAQDRMASALDKMEQALSRIEAQYEALNGKVDRIIAAVEEEKKEDAAEVNAEAEKATRKTVSPVIANLLAKSGVEMASVEDATIEKALAGLSVEQRIAVKAELARAGVLQ